MQVVFSSSDILITHIGMWLSVVQKHCDLGLLSAGQGMAEKRVPGPSLMQQSLPLLARQHFFCL